MTITSLFTTLGKKTFGEKSGLVCIGKQMRLSLQDVASVARRNAFVSMILPPGYNSLNTIRFAITSEKPTYGVDTGFGIFRDIKISIQDLAQLQLNIINSHDAGIGEYLPLDIVRGMELIRLSALSQGHSGMTAKTLQALTNLINSDIYPLIPECGSVGASGDLAPLSALARVLTGDPRKQVNYLGRVMNADEALKIANIEPIVPAPKEGLGLTNGTSLMASYLALNLIDMFNIFKNALIINNMAFEARLATSDALEPEIHELRNQTGQQQVAAVQRELLNNGRGLYTNRLKVQDPYDLRCSPQIIGPFWETLRTAANVGTRELTAVTDNPIYLRREAKWASGGNFHGMTLAQQMDTLAISNAGLANLFSSQADAITNPHLSNGLPPCLVYPGSSTGLESSFMIPQYTIADLTAQLRFFANPASIHSISTGGGVENIVSMGRLAGWKLRFSVDTLFNLLTVQAAITTQALMIRRNIIETKFQNIIGELTKEGSSTTKEEMANDPVYQYLLQKGEVNEQLNQGVMPDMSFTPANEAAVNRILSVAPKNTLPLKTDTESDFPSLYIAIEKLLREETIISDVENALKARIAQKSR